MEKFQQWCITSNYRKRDMNGVCVAISVRIDIFSRIEFKQASILSSNNTNYKNDIQWFMCLFDGALSKWRLPLTLIGVVSAPNSGMTIHTLVLTVDSFS